jgi:predicted DsbA family dithiol-disulfide isomerase
MTDPVLGTETLPVTMIADFACPWCRIGKANLDAALAQWTGAPVDLTLLPFLLDPSLPSEGKDFREHLSQKFQGAPIDAMFDRVSQAGASAGVEFRWDLVGKSPNTILAHQLIDLAPDAVKSALSTAIYDAYFQQGKDITDLDTLLDLAEVNGLDRASLRERLLAGDGATEVRSIARQVSQQGVSGVPFFIFDGKLALNGAQPAHVILEAMRQAAEPVATPAD